MDGHDFTAFLVLTYENDGIGPYEVGERRLYDEGQWQLIDVQADYSGTTTSQAEAIKEFLSQPFKRLSEYLEEHTPTKYNDT